MTRVARKIVGRCSHGIGSRPHIPCTAGQYPLAFALVVIQAEVRKVGWERDRYARVIGGVSARNRKILKHLDKWRNMFEEMAPCADVLGTNR